MDLTQMMNEEELAATGADLLTSSQKMELAAWGTKMFSIGQYRVSDIEEIIMADALSSCRIAPDEKSVNSIQSPQKAGLFRTRSLLSTAQSGDWMILRGSNQERNSRETGK